MLHMSNTMRMLLKKLLHCKLPLGSCIFRQVSVEAKQKFSAVECLNNRGILRVSGKESSLFLQGLITNDMRHLEEGAPSMYTMFLNNKGRVMYDAIIYRLKEEGVFFIECDQLALSHLQKHLKMFRVRRKIEIENITDELRVWVVYDPELSQTDFKQMGQVLYDHLNESTINETIINNLKNRHDVIVCRDPRLSTLGARILAPTDEDISLQNDKEKSMQQENRLSYRAFRYRLGIGEGVNDMPPENCFPLEANGDYLHGISFQKGCYIGQELTARTHHTGVVRKRLMPVFFESVPQTKLEVNTSVQLPSGGNKVALGKLRGVEGKVGLALLRITEALDASKLKILDETAETIKPHWWPQEAPKERGFSGKG